MGPGRIELSSAEEDGPEISGFLQAANVAAPRTPVNLSEPGGAAAVLENSGFHGPVIPAVLPPPRQPNVRENETFLPFTRGRRTP